MWRSIDGSERVTVDNNLDGVCDISPRLERLERLERDIRHLLRRRYVPPTSSGLRPLEGSYSSSQGLDVLEA